MQILNNDAASPATHVFDVGVNDFAEKVVARSQEVPVVIDFWAPWCEPCKTLTPILEELARELAGAFELAKVNIDDEQQLAAQFQVRSVPSVYVVKDGTVVDGFLGAQPKHAIQEMLSKHMNASADAPQSDPIRDLIAQNRIEEAMALLRKDGSENARIQLANLHVHRGEHDVAREVLDTIGDESRNDPRFKTADAAIFFHDIAQAIGDEPELRARSERDAADWDAHYKLAVIMLGRGEFDAALEKLLEIVKGGREYGDDAARLALVRAFDMLGANSELVSKYRRLLALTLN